MNISGEILRKALRRADITQEKAANALGMSRQTLSNWLKSAELPENIVNNVKTIFKINLSIVDNNIQNVENSLHNDLTHKPLILNDSNKPINKGWDKNSTKDVTPMYDNPGTASQVEVYNDLQSEGPAFYVSIPQFRDCDFGKSIYGHSMYPTIESGTYIFCKKVENKAVFLPGEIYYIEYDNFAVCKRLKKGPNPDEILLVSDNEEETKDGKRRFEDYVLKIDVIDKMFIVKGYFSQSHN